MRSIHGVLVSVDNVGILVTGEPGSGKSSLALELLNAGHRLVADDVIEVTDTGDQLIGSAPDRFRGAIEVRGLGVLDAIKLFGEHSVMHSSPIEICLELRKGSGGSLDRESSDLLGNGVRLLSIDADSPIDRRAFVETAVKLFTDPSIMLSGLNDPPEE